MITIYKYDGSGIRAMLSPDDTSAQDRQLMGVDNVTLSVKLAVPLTLRIGDFATIFSDEYKLNTLPVRNKTAKREYLYTILLEGLIGDIGKVQYLFLDPSNHFTDSRFSMKTDALGYLRLIIYNLERVYPGHGWQIGSCVIGTEYKNLEFDANNCLEVLARLAEQYNTEYLIEGRKISLYRKQLPSGITLEYGYEKPLIALTEKSRDNSNVITRLYAYGSDRNLGSNYRSGTKRLRMAASLYLEKYTDRYGISEDTVIFDDIYPHRTGTVTGVDTPFIFYDTAIDFDVNTYVLPGITAKITFSTGLLAGYEFQVSAFSNSLKKFTILANTDDQTVAVPSVILTPAVGDKYVITDITMPLSYVNAAESELRSRTQALLDQKSDPILNQDYTVIFNALWFKRNSATVEISQSLRLLDPDMDIDRPVRILGYSRNINEPSIYAARLGDTIPAQSTLVKLINGI